MKTIAFFGLLILAGFTQEQKNDTATVDKINGVYVFIHSKPAREYEVLKSGKTIVLLHSDEVITHPIKVAQKEKADGVIINVEGNHYDIIKFR
jgi:hypothetical protein